MALKNEISGAKGEKKAAEEETKAARSYATHLAAALMQAERQLVLAGDVPGVDQSVQEEKLSLLMLLREHHIL